ncbi:unnamed protein product, partial [marine sediment metagenome]
GPYPASIYEYLGMGQMRKYSFARVRFCPIAYYPASGELVLYNSITVQVDYEIVEELPHELLRDAVMDDVASQIILNYLGIRPQYLPPPGPLPASASYDYVIITTDGLVSTVDTFKTWKESLGYSVNVVTKDWIDSNYSGADIQEKIRNFLIDKYAAWGIKYVLIVGPHTTGTASTNIPMRICYPDPTDHTTDYAVPTDYYYAELTGNWDSDGDGWYGEYGQDNPDYYPEVYVGRWLTDDPT